MPNAFHKQDVEIGATYRVRLHGKFTEVRIDAEGHRGRGWTATNLATGRTVYIKSAAKLRRKTADAAPLMS